MDPVPIPFNRPGRTGKELAYLEQALAQGHISGDGAFTKKCHALLSELHGGAPVLLTTSCTHALELAALLLGLEKGDEVIVPSFTFVSTANAFAVHGARLVFADIRPDTLNLDEEGLEKLIGPRTRAIVPVHYAGIGCRMERINEIAARSGLTVVEDNAHGLMGKWNGRTLGTFGALATLSFHETKNFTCGEGGALVLNDRRFVERAEIIREKGTDRSKFFRGLVDKYTWVDIGSSYVMSDMLAAFLLAQLEQREAIQARRREIWQRYDTELAGWARERSVQTPTVPSLCEQAFHMYYLVMPASDARDGLIAHLRANGAQAVFHYLPLHLSPMGKRFGGRDGDCPVTESVSGRLLRLPFHCGLSEEEQATVIRAVREWRVCRQ